MTGRRADETPCCGHWVGVERRYCHATQNVRAFLTGLRCPAHTPNALAGKPETPPGPGMPAGAWSTPSPLNDSRVHDARAVASGKRRANPQAYRAAQAAVGQRPAAGIRVDPGQRDAHGKAWIRIPTADYLCPACHETESASGDQVAHFAAHIETEHAARCPANPQGAEA
ncbi:hypothetical protein ACIQCF_07560 [Streptomyces sp. NPDC088353]|uniref:hypothetical protein n=1 Tax=Streptomyces sp. NPDC088353 TaxID=3365855 RepID=UPI00380DC956